MNIEHPHKEIREQIDKCPGQRVKPCGTHTMFGPSLAVKLYCGRRDCPICGNYRLVKTTEVLTSASLLTQQDIVYARVPKSKREALATKFRRHDAPCAIFPQENDLVWVTFTGYTALLGGYNIISVDLNDIKKFSKEALTTPTAERIRFSSNFPRPKVEKDNTGTKEEVEMDKVPEDSTAKFITDLPITEYVLLINKLGVETRWNAKFDKVYYTTDEAMWNKIKEEVALTSNMWRIVKNKVIPFELIQMSV